MRLIITTLLLAVGCGGVQRGYCDFSNAPGGSLPYRSFTCQERDAPDSNFKRSCETLSATYGNGDCPSTSLGQSRTNTTCEFEGWRIWFYYSPSPQDLNQCVKDGGSVNSH